VHPEGTKVLAALVHEVEDHLSRSIREAQHCSKFLRS
jgi:hypothetical protein